MPSSPGQQPPVREEQDNRRPHDHTKPRSAIEHRGGPCHPTLWRSAAQQSADGDKVGCEVDRVASSDGQQEPTDRVLGTTTRDQDTEDSDDGRLEEMRELRRARRVDRLAIQGK